MSSKLVPKLILRLSFSFSLRHSATGKPRKRQKNEPTKEEINIYPQQQNQIEAKARKYKGSSHASSAGVRWGAGRAPGRWLQRSTMALHTRPSHTQPTHTRRRPSTQRTPLPPSVRPLCSWAFSTIATIFQTIFGRPPRQTGLDTSSAASQSMDRCFHAFSSPSLDPQHSRPKRVTRVMHIIGFANSSPRLGPARPD
jgi:hypothetical protein